MGGSAEEPIDLTFDSDSDNELGPSQPTVATSRLPQKTPVPLSGSLPRPFVSSAAPQRQYTSTSASGFPLASGSPKPEKNPLYTTVDDIPANVNGATPTRPPDGIEYVPVFAAATPGGGADDFAVPQAGKRRKTSGPPHILETIESGPIRRRSVLKPRFYGVQVGHVPGVYTDYDAVKAQIVGCKGAKQQRFETREEAQAFVDGRPSVNPRLARNRETHGRGGAGPSPLVSLPLESPATTHTERPGTRPTFLARHSANGQQSVGGRSPPTTAKLNTNGLPSVQSLNTAMKGNGTTKSLNGRNELSRGRRELHFGRVSEATSNNGATKPASNGVAVSQSSADEMMIDQEHALPPQQTTLGLPSTEQGTFVESALEPKNHFLVTNDSLAEDPLNTLLEDDIISELLQQVSANDKVALLLQGHPRGQLIARTMQQLSIEVNPTRQPHGQSTLRDIRSLSALSPSENDSVFSDSDTPANRDAAQVDNVVSDSSTMHRVAATVEQPSACKKWTGALSEAEAHLLIFLKEVKKLSWSEVTAKFQEHYHARKYSTLQTTYSQKINRRDRSQDPATLILPSMYASEAHVEWAGIYANPSRTNNFPQQKRQVLSLQEEPKHRAWSAAGSSLQDQSSGAESPGHYTRPRRGVPVKSYTWPKKNARIEGSSFGEDALDAVEPAEERFALSETSEDLNPLPDKAIAVNKEPLSVDFDKEDAFYALAVQNRGAGTDKLPYLSSSQRSDLQNVPRGFEWDQLVSRDWQGTLLHVDFSPVELNFVESTITRLLGPQQDFRSRSQRKRIRKLLHEVTEPKLLQLAGSLRFQLHSRDRQSIDAFLRDAKEDKIRCAAPRIERLAASRPNKSFSSEAKLSTSSVIRRRELGIRSNRGWGSATLPVSYQLKNKVQDSLGPICSYTGASSDVHTVAWSVDGECFAAGAICVDDDHSMQYNRSNNLLYGDVSCNIINELGNHYVKRPKTDSGPNSTHAMFASQDPKLFKTVTSVAFSPNGRYMFSGGWDQNVWVWETKYDGSQPTDVVSLHHKSEVSMMAVNASGVLATGTRKSMGNAIKVLKLCEDDPTQTPVTLNFNSEKAAARPDLLIRPTALHFSPRYENLLLGGFGANAVQDGRAMSGGDICLWDINGNKPLSIWGSGKNVFDLAFHPRERWMAVAAVAGQSTNRGIRSTVRLYSEQNNAMDNKFSMHMELECGALDINDVVWW
jgi:WD40 repeat protein